MKNNTINTYYEEQHPWKLKIPEGADKLIIGTFPTANRNRGDIDFFYPNPNNQFWNVLRAVQNGSTEIDFTVILTKKQRIDLLKLLNLGITDMGLKVLRQQNSSLDKNLFVTEFTDIINILNDNPNIIKLIFCSSSGSNSAVGWSRSYCKLNGIKFPKLTGNNPKRTRFELNSREIEIVTVHSTSRAAARKLEELVEMYMNEIKVK